MVETLTVWSGLVRRLYLMDSAGTRRLPRTCTSSITCGVWDCAVLATKRVQEITKSAAFIRGAVVKAAIVWSWTAPGSKTLFGRLCYCIPWQSFSINGEAFWIDSQRMIWRGREEGPKESVL